MLPATHADADCEYRTTSEHSLVGHYERDREPRCPAWLRRVPGPADQAARLPGDVEAVSGGGQGRADGDESGDLIERGARGQGHDAGQPDRGCPGGEVQ